MAAPQSSPLPEAPTRGEAEGQFVPKANAFVGALEPFRQQLQRQADYVNTRTSQLEQAATRAENAESGALDAEATSAANANFAGNWSSLSGSYSVPTSVFHEGYFWALVQNVSSIGDHEPGESSAWAIIQRAFRELSVEPTLSSNFRTGEHKLYGVQDGYKSRDLADIWDVTRASGETVLTPAGRLATVDPDTLPLTYVPETGGLGAQVTGAVTNLLLWSEDFTQGDGWTSLTNGQLNQTAITSPAGDGFFYEVVPDGGAISTLDGHGLALSENTNYTLSLFVKTNGLASVLLRLRDLSGTQGPSVEFSFADEIINPQAGASGGFESLGGGVYRVWAVLPSGEGAGSPRARLQFPSGDGTSGIYIWGAQLAQSSGPLPYVKTESSTVTKPATNVVRELGEEFNWEEFTVLAEFVPRANEGLFRGIVGIGDTSKASNAFTLYLDQNVGQARAQRYDSSGITRSSSPSGTVVPGQHHRAAMRLSGDVLTLFLDGIKYSDVQVPLDNIEDLDVSVLGNLRHPQDDFFLNGDITEHEIIPRALSDAELIEWTRG